MLRLRLLAIALATLAYVVLPADLVPDFMPLVGWLDDLLVALLGLWAFKRRWDALRSGRPAAPDEDRALLGVGPGAGEEELRKAYLRRMAECLPDEAERPGPERRRAAREAQGRVQRAYDRLRGKP